MSYDALPTAPQARIAEGGAPCLGHRPATPRTFTLLSPRPADSGLTMHLASNLQAVRRAAMSRARDAQPQAIPTHLHLGLARNEGFVA